MAVESPDPTDVLDQDAEAVGGVRLDRGEPEEDEERQRQEGATPGDHVESGGHEARADQGQELEG